jgi:hypothetical protein
MTNSSNSQAKIFSSWICIQAPEFRISTVQYMKYVINSNRFLFRFSAGHQQCSFDVQKLSTAVDNSVCNYFLTFLVISIA